MPNARAAYPSGGAGPLAPHLVTEPNRTGGEAAAQPENDPATCPLAAESLPSHRDLLLFVRTDSAGPVERGQLPGRPTCIRE